MLELSVGVPVPPRGTERLYCVFSGQPEDDPRVHHIGPLAECQERLEAIQASRPGEPMTILGAMEFALRTIRA